MFLFERRKIIYGSEMVQGIFMLAVTDTCTKLSCYMYQKNLSMLFGHNSFTGNKDKRLEIVFEKSNGPTNMGLKERSCMSFLFTRPPGTKACYRVKIWSKLLRP